LEPENVSYLLFNCSRFYSLPPSLVLLVYIYYDTVIKKITLFFFASSLNYYEWYWNNRKYLQTLKYSRIVNCSVMGNPPLNIDIIYLKISTYYPFFIKPGEILWPVLKSPSMCKLQGKKSRFFHNLVFYYN